MAREPSVTSVCMVHGGAKMEPALLALLDMLGLNLQLQVRRWRS